ncbi:hypothetical protein C8R47DRAFT_1067164 [Mycena vitilis]|nr:hypothetical protein C8R47DRAFT_1067164 [Mycena vitilis]
MHEPTPRSVGPHTRPRSRDTLHMKTHKLDLASREDFPPLNHGQDRPPSPPMDIRCTDNGRGHGVGLEATNNASSRRGLASNVFQCQTDIIELAQQSKLKRAAREEEKQQRRRQNYQMAEPEDNHGDVPKSAGVDDTHRQNQAVLEHAVARPPPFSSPGSMFFQPKETEVDRAALKEKLKCKRAQRSKDKEDRKEERKRNHAAVATGVC